MFSSMLVFTTDMQRCGKTALPCCDFECLCRVAVFPQLVQCTWPNMVFRVSTVRICDVRNRSMHGLAQGQQQRSICSDPRVCFGLDRESTRWCNRRLAVAPRFVSYSSTLHHDQSGLTRC